tara:strand:- start:10125 stop:11321 length:1197 start_codon:yes stop_codon:yes gene_type:complete
MEKITDIFVKDTSRFQTDLKSLEFELKDTVKSNSFLILGGAGSIGSSVTKEIFKRNPKKLHVVDISENNMAELVRDIRSSYGYIKGDFKTFILDCDSDEFNAWINNSEPYDYILNLSALKHVRSEKDPYTLMRMIKVNIVNTISTIQIAKDMDVKKYFCVSTDKATDPINMMGASKKIMELFLFKESENINISAARFANVAFSDGSLLDSFNYRFLKKQPIVAPKDIQRYFINLQEAGELCLLSCLYGRNRDIFFPKIEKSLKLWNFSDIAKEFIKLKGFKIYECASEEEARKDAATFIQKGYWPCFFFDTDTTGEKEFEEFFSNKDVIDLDSFENIGIVKNEIISKGLNKNLENFIKKINDINLSKEWKKSDLVRIFQLILPNFKHLEKGKYLDEKM